MSIKGLKLFLFLLLFLCLVFTAGVFAVKVTFIGNSGFILESEGKKIAIDSFFKGFPGRYTLPLKVIDQMKRSVPPFDDIDIILSTHLHADHLKIGYVSDYMVKNKNTVFISTEESLKIMEKNLPEFLLYSNRVEGLNPGWGKTKKISVEGIKLRAFGMPHGSNPVQQNCFMFSLGNKKFVYLGDLSGDRVQRIFRETGINTETFDFAFIPYWYLTSKKNAGIIKKNINAEYIIAMHLSLTDSNNDISYFIRSIRTNFPDSIIFTRELQTKVF